MAENFKEVNVISEKGTTQPGEGIE